MRGKETIFEKLVSFPRTTFFPKNFQKERGDFCLDFQMLICRGDAGDAIATFLYKKVAPKTFHQKR